MSITSIVFLFCFLPTALVIYYISPDKIKEYVLLIVSFIFYAIGNIEYFCLFIVATIINVILGRMIWGARTKNLKKLLLIIGIVANAGILVYYKYTDFVLLTWSDIFKAEVQLKNLVLPMGISFFTFKAISYLVDVYTEKARLSEKPVTDALYLSFFAQIQSGPLTRYNESFRMAEGINLFRYGAYKFLIGFNKKVLLANVLANITDEVFSTSIENFSTPYAWLGSICFSLQLFFDFSGYSDMAIGISGMFGYKCKENFNFPYMTESVTKFWRRWHISLSEWFKDYIYIPLGGSRNKHKWRVYFNLFVVWILTGIWHGASWNFVAWGLGYFVFIAFERLTCLPDRLNTKTGKVIYRFISLVFINFEWVVFKADGLTYALRFIKRMILPYSNELNTSRTLFLLKDYGFFITVSLILCFPLVGWIDEKLENKNILHKIYEIGVSVIVVLGFIWALSYVISDQNNPFAYANF